MSHLPLLGGDSLDRWRLAALRDSSVRLPLLRSSSSLLAPLPGASDAWRWAWVAPVVGAGIQGGMPRPSGDMPIWTGRGFNALALGGVRVERGRLRLVLAPTVAASTNTTYALIPATPLGEILAPPLPPDRSEFAAPWYTSPNSIDLPLRFGREGVGRLDPGQSALTLGVGAVEVGVATENEWWGPGLRNALVLSDNASGFPHLLLRSRRPWRTPLGFVELRYLLGGLSESAYFDTLGTNDVRSFSGLAVAVRPRGVAGLTVGASRVVYAPVSGWEDVPGRALDVFRDTGRPSAVPASDSTMLPGPDQLLSLFGQWVLPEDGFEAYLELGRAEMPASIRDLLQFPNHTLGYVVGVQWARPVRDAASILRLQLELTSTEQSPTYRNRPIGT
ncbi:MAG TPA: hypothetical protein VFY16_03990, partial [Gemmatimonadaceae bacterium]|nr:hypothetical protein [Gemmatimonadaceae bacterium]